MIAHCFSAAEETCVNADLDPGFGHNPVSHIFVFERDGQRQQVSFPNFLARSTGCLSAGMETFELSCELLP